jgi:hypothetical protein
MDKVRKPSISVGWGGMGWIGLAQDWDKWKAFVNTVMKLGSIKYWEILEQLQTWRLVKKGSTPWS